MPIVGKKCSDQNWIGTEKAEGSDIPPVLSHCLWLITNRENGHNDPDFVGPRHRLSIQPHNHSMAVRILSNNWCLGLLTNCTQRSNLCCLAAQWREFVTLLECSQDKWRLKKTLWNTKWVVAWKKQDNSSALIQSLTLLVNLVFVTWKDWVSSQWVNSNFLYCSRKLTSPVEEWKSPLLWGKTRACSKILDLDSLSVTLFTQIYRTRSCSASPCDTHTQSRKHDVTHRFMSPLIHLMPSSAVKTRAYTAGFENH